MGLWALIFNRLKTSLNEDRQIKLRRFQSLHFRYLQHIVCRLFFCSNLKFLSEFYGTDKWGSHWYVKNYEKHFSSIKNKKLNILEIGIGGFREPEFGGGSLRAWRTYFPKSKIYGIDIYDRRVNNERRIKTFKGSQIDIEFLSNVVDVIGKIDIVIDDGSHENEHVLRTFQFLFPRLSENGFYVIEDTQTSYWPSYGGSKENLIILIPLWGFSKH